MELHLNAHTVIFRHNSWVGSSSDPERDMVSSENGWMDGWHSSLKPLQLFPMKNLSSVWFPPWKCTESPLESQEPKFVSLLSVFPVWWRWLAAPWGHSAGHPYTSPDPLNGNLSLVFRFWLLLSRFDSLLTLPVSTKKFWHKAKAAIVFQGVSPTSAS